LSHLIMSLKSTGTTILIALKAHQTSTSIRWLLQLCCPSCTRL
jgi:hypothetical protein